MTKWSEVCLYVKKKVYIHSLINSNTQSENFSFAMHLEDSFWLLLLQGLLNVTPLQVKKKDNFT